MDSFWPLFGLRLHHRDVLLRPMREADLAPLAAMLPGDVGHDPRLAMFESQSFEENERRLFCQGYWRSMATGTRRPGSCTSSSGSPANRSACRRWRARTSRACARSTRPPG